LGCANVYHRQGTATGAFSSDTGYHDTQQGFGKYVVSYRSQDLAFSKKACLYRVAQLCREQGFKYFLIKDEQVLHDFIPRPNAEAAGLDTGWQNALDPNTSSESLEKLPPAGYSYRVEFSNVKTEGFPYREPSEILDQGPAPGTKENKDGSEHAQ
jgi:hypothetical protein